MLPAGSDSLFAASVPIAPASLPAVRSQTGTSIRTSHGTSPERGSTGNSLEGRDRITRSRAPMLSAASRAEDYVGERLQWAALRERRSDHTAEHLRPIGPQPDDLAIRLRQRDPDALGQLFREHGRRALGLAYDVLGDHALAEDAVQDAFVSLWERAHLIEPGRGRVAALLMTIVHRRAIDALRSRAQRGASGEPVEEAIDERAAELLDRVLDSLASERTRLHMRESLASLPAEQREAVELAYFRGLTHSEIASATSAPVGTVKSRLRLGLGKLRDSLGIMVQA